MLSSTCKFLVNCCALQHHLSTSWTLPKSNELWALLFSRNCQELLLPPMSPQVKQLSFLCLLFLPLSATSSTPFPWVSSYPIFFKGRVHQRCISDVFHISQLVFGLCLAEIKWRIRLFSVVSSKRIPLGCVTTGLSPHTWRSADEQWQLVAGAYPSLRAQPYPTVKSSWKGPRRGHVSPSVAWDRSQLLFIWDRCILEDRPDFTLNTLNSQLLPYKETSSLTLPGSSIYLTQI